MSGALALAASIAAMDRGELTALVAGRRVLSPDSVQDPLGLALELLRPDSISRALRIAHRDWLEALLALAQDRPADPAVLRELAKTGLVGRQTEGGEWAPLPEIEDALRCVELPDPRDDAAEPAARAETSTWFAPALTSVRRAAELLRAMHRRPARLGRKGAPMVTAVRELAEAIHADATAVGRLLTSMETAGLLAHEPGHRDSAILVPSALAHRWLALDYPHRWVALATAAIAPVDERLRRYLDGLDHDLRRALARLPLDYPLLPAADFDAVERFAHTAEDLGLAVGGALTPAARLLLEGEVEAASELAEREMPRTVAGVYLQPDLSLIVPGPLAPRDEAALGAIAETEQLGPAASMRLSSRSLERAVRAGIAPDAIRRLLQRLSLTGVPQPLDFLLGELERRHPEGAGDPSDSANPFAADEAGETAETADGTGSPEPAAPLGTHGAAAPPGAQAPHPGARILDTLVDRVLAATLDGGQGDLSRRLELAIRDRSPVQVTAVAAGDARVFTLLPVSLRGGRLRATDQQAGVERTLPMSAITAVEAA